ncbi:MAG: hypothetical protein CL677_06095 [Bdellovibrionaceae bacterium]|nr:hypothetical protein [Pseudobdellovibrionaceae bacterium]|tara:strand:+ start:76800 stop:78185 length:1386 start_codon:yes stop_codon:yes gene_type:complete
MNKKTGVLALTLSLLFSVSSLGADGAANGGDVVVCNAGSASETTELLDLFEIQDKYQFELRLPEGELSAEENAIYQLDRLIEWQAHPILTRKILEFSSRIDFVEDLEDIDDSEHGILPDNCYLEQVASNQGDGRIQIDEGLWGKLDSANKGALIIHELIYEELFKIGYTNSIATRLFNGLLHVNKMKPNGRSNWRFYDIPEPVISEYGIVQNMKHISNGIVEVLVKTFPDQGYVKNFEALKNTFLVGLKVKIVEELFKKNPHRLDSALKEYLLDSLKAPDSYEELRYVTAIFGGIARYYDGDFDGLTVLKDKHLNIFEAAATSRMVAPRFYHQLNIPFLNILLRNNIEYNFNDRNQFAKGFSEIVKTCVLAKRTEFPNMQWSCSGHIFSSVLRYYNLFSGIAHPLIGRTIIRHFTDTVVADESSSSCTDFAYAKYYFEKTGDESKEAFEDLDLYHRYRCYE